MEFVSKRRSNSEYHFRDMKLLVHGFVYTDYSIDPHDHDFYEMNIVLRGSGIHRIDQVCVQVRRGDVFVIPPFTTHAYYDTKDLDVYHVLLHKKLIAENYREAIGVPGFLQLVEIEPFLRQRNARSMFLHLSQSQLLQLQKDLQYIEDNGMFEAEEMIPLKHHVAWKILYELSFLLDRQIHREPVGSDRYDSIIMQVLVYIHQNFGEKITIDRLCKHVFLSRSTFLRSFSGICGCTPMQYLDRYRCEKALEMMEQHRLSKTEIAQSCGFYDLSHMERALKRRYTS